MSVNILKKRQEKMRRPLFYLAEKTTKKPLDDARKNAEGALNWQKTF
jgi:hypothetical protein